MRRRPRDRDTTQFVMRDTPIESPYVSGPYCMPGTHIIWQHRSLSALEEVPGLKEIVTSTPYLTSKRVATLICSLAWYGKMPPCRRQHDFDSS